MSEPDGPDTDDVNGDNVSISEVYRRRGHGRSYFTPPGASDGRRDAVRERLRRGSR